MSAVETLPKPITVSAPTGKASLPVYEIAKGKLARPRGKIRPLVGPQSNIPFSAWNMFHAAAKTELAQSVSASGAIHLALGLVHLCKGMFAWSGGNLRLHDGAIASRKDSSRTYLSGRFGEALTYLFMLSQKYVFWDHLPSLVERAIKRSYSTHPEQSRVAKAILSKIKKRSLAEQPDFAFEKAAGEVALVESKGSFVPRTRKGTIKQDLNKALSQLASWELCIRPKPQQLFAVGSYLREKSDHSAEPSLLAFADPVGNPPDDDNVANFPDDWIRRGNYGAWLCGMGFEAGGEALRTGMVHDGVEQPLPVILIDNWLFAFSIAGFGTFGGRASTPPKKGGKQAWTSGTSPSGTSIELLISLLAAGRAPLITGVEVGRLRIIESVLSAPRDQGLMGIEEFFENPNISSTPLLDYQMPEWYEGSMLSDGTLIGLLDVSNPQFPGIEFRNFTL